MPTKSTTPVVQPEDYLVLRTNGGEQSFTGNEFPMAMELARAAGYKGRAVLLAYTYRKRCKLRTAAVVVWSAAEERAKAEAEAREAREAASKPVRKTPAPKIRKMPAPVRERERTAVA